MEDLLDSQIKDSCRLALPEGLKELMADITREVLRAQPKNLYQFIAKYLSALLLTREHLSIAAHVCGDVCDNVCHPPLDDELREIGLDEEDVVTAVKTIRKFFESADVKEDSLILQLIKETELSEYQLPSIVEVVREAYIRNKLKHSPPDETVSDQTMDDVTRAVKNTMNIYKKTEPSEHQKCVMAKKIQAAYRAYKVRRSISKEKLEIREIPKQHRSSLVSSRSIRFESKVEYNTSSNNESQDTQESDQHEIVQKFVKTVSSASLAGSFMKLHPSEPYSAVDHDIEEKQERVHTYNDYVDDEENSKRKQINFHNSEVIDDEAGFADDDSDASVPDESKLPEFNEKALEGNGKDNENVNKKLQYKTSSRNVAKIETAKASAVKEIEVIYDEDDDDDHFYV